MTDPYGSDAGRLQAAIAAWLRDHGHTDPAVGAVELMHMVRGHGWRPVPALQPPERREDRPAPGPTPEYMAAKAAITRERNP
jgi:hypothetical protein